MIRAVGEISRARLSGRAVRNDRALRYIDTYQLNSSKDAIAVVDVACRR